MESSEKVKYSASSKYVRMSPFKVRRILDQIRGRSSVEALTILKFMPYKACPIIFKVLYSAISNAKRNSNIDTASLSVLDAKADSGPILKRFCPHAKGRGFPIKKRLCHITSLS
uniref:ribosomal protein L22 n=1 Tax=Euglena agilis TaxID=96764 RepID=UPI0023AAE152|nr:ribosomal protein L22 [Euglena agilis]WCH63327.1 ribosomal protein L22 [Euglena agilis]